MVDADDGRSSTPEEEAVSSVLFPSKRPFSTLESSPKRDAVEHDTSIRPPASLVSTHLSSQALKSVLEGKREDNRMPLVEESIQSDALSECSNQDIKLGQGSLKSMLEYAMKLNNETEAGDTSKVFVDKSWWDRFEAAANLGSDISHAELAPVHQALPNSQASNIVSLNNRAWTQLVAWFGEETELVNDASDMGESIQHQRNVDVEANQEHDPGHIPSEFLSVDPPTVTASDGAMDLTSDTSSESANPMASEAESDLGQVQHKETYTVWIIPEEYTGLSLTKLSIEKSRFHANSLSKLCTEAMRLEDKPEVEFVWIVDAMKHGVDLSRESTVSRSLLNKVTSVTLTSQMATNDTDWARIFYSPEVPDTIFCCAKLEGLVVVNDKYQIPFNVLRSVVPGTTGLGNMGNTCYMNSALQCLLHVEELSSFFLTDCYKKELNVDNPIGCNGDMGVAFARLVKDVLPGKNKVFSPYDFKKTLVKYAQTFAGWSQQDTQEFLAFLLDSLHEDLNRIIKKPAVPKPELPEGTSPDDQEAVIKLGEDSWETHKKRNDSVILDLFTGMYRSVLVCPSCNNVSITFDPFMDLTLPLPTANNLWIQDVYVVPMKGSGPIVVKACVERTATFAELKQYLSKLTGISPNLLEGGEVYEGSFFVMYDDKDIVSATISADDIPVFCELSDPVTKDGDNDSTKAFSATVLFTVGNKAPKSLGWPLIIAVTEAMATDLDTLRDTIVSRFETVNEVIIKGSAADSRSVKSATSYERMHVPGEFPTPEPEESTQTEIEIEDESDMEIVESTTEIGPSVVELKYAPAGRGVGVRTSPLYMARPIKDRVQDENFVMVSSNTSTTSDIEVASEIQLSDDENRNEDLAESNIGSIMTNNSVVDDEDGSLSSKEDTEPDDNAGTRADVPIRLLLPGECIIVNWPGCSDVKVRQAERLENVHAEAAIKESEEKKRHVAHISDCLDLFSQTEVLSADDLWYCSRCKEHRQATKTIELWKVPDILIIHLKRFASFRSFRDKIDDAVKFPLEALDMRQWIKAPQEDTGESYLYDLFAIDDHFGGLRGGHYTATVKNHIDGRWYCYNDGSVRPEEPSTESSSAYLLFYRRRSSLANPLGGEYMGEVLEAGRKSLSQWEYRNEDEPLLTPNTYDEYVRKKEEEDGPRRVPPVLPERPSYYPRYDVSDSPDKGGQVLGHGSSYSLVPWRDPNSRPFGTNIDNDVDDNMSGGSAHEVAIGDNVDSDDDFASLEPLGG